MKLPTLLPTLILAVALPAQKPDPALSDLRAAIDKEVADGDLKSAIALYDKVAETHKANKPIAAQALLRLGQSHEKLGQADAAIAYKRLLTQYADQKEAADARARLTALTRLPADSPAMSVQLLLSQPALRLARGRVALDGQTFPYFGVDGNLFVRDLRSASTRQLTHHESPEIAGRASQPVPSRDGGRIAYAWSGPNAWSGIANRYELRVIPSTGGTPRTIPLKLEPNVQVTPWDWSPDGRSLAVLAFNLTTGGWSVAIADVASGELRSLFSRRPDRCERGNFSADGRLLVASCRPNVNSKWGISVIDVATGAVTPILASSATDRDPVWLPTPGKIAFVSDRRGRNGLYITEYRNGAGTPPLLVNGDIGDSILLGVGKDGTFFYGRETINRDIFLANLDPDSLRIQGTPVRFVEDHLGHNSAPSWSPSGESFAYTSARDINDGNRIVIRTSNEKEAVTSDTLRWPLSPIWCGSSRLLVQGTPNPSTRRLYDARTGSMAQPDFKIEGLIAPYQLTYSSDCAAAYVSSYSHTTKRRRIYRIDLDTRKETDLYSDDAGWSIVPTVSPDGRWLALVGTLVKGGPYGLLILPTAGGAPRMLTTLSDNNFLRWTSDSKHIFFVRDSNGEQEIFASPLDGAPLKPTGIRGSGIIGPSLHPDGKRALYSVENTTSEVWSLHDFIKN